MYDYVIIGGGPSGLTLAWCLAQYNKKVLIVERENSLGGCHRVNRVNGLFTEHGPRIYLGNGKTFKFILNDMGLSFDKLFVQYKFGGFSIGLQVIKRMTILEMWAIMNAYFNFMISDDYSKKISMEEFMDSKGFSQEIKDYIDGLCRMTDGAEIDRYTLYEFLEIINQNLFYKIYHPKVPNDVGLFYYWKDALEKTGNCDIWLNTEVVNINSDKNRISSVCVVKDDQKYNIKNSTYIFAIPPKNFVNLLLKNPQVRSAFGDFNTFRKWQKNTEYLLYIPIIFHWDVKIQLERVWGSPSFDWGVAFIILSDYTNFNDSRSKTVITTCITSPNKKSSYLNKTPHECNQNELVEEVFRQLKQTHKNLPPFTAAIISPEMYRENDKWTSKDSSYVRTVDGFINAQSPVFKNLYSLGTHNGNSFYNFTSIEAAVSNSVALLNELIPESKNKYKVIQFVTVKYVVIFLIIILLMFIIYKNSNKSKNLS